MNRWRTVLLWAGLALVLLVVNRGIAQREQLLRDGTVVLLELAPVDPRSLMQGDYMALRFAAGDNITDALRADGRMPRVDSDWRATPGGANDGYAIFARDADGVGRFIREQNAPTPRANTEVAVRYRQRGSDVRIASNAFFFAEGQAERYAPARYGELRVADDGAALLTGLRDAARKPL
ncbi:GDYXXLXY domain-containing protein [Lysobacter sp. CFH 32150]|uniref:GDYXXLXY domain-containing protein n=1 Tax=Lysobacter sp. CFH 32150 TaxID=2927128 RepID=UPI001FA72DB7|nr:GDYXXLXY domain-containing protein [Lysobacter sp. CFH 32150]MCI4569184.1 GDYXXLXY domain-containing protein [Lysobacter sp. CFH 32150]